MKSSNRISWNAENDMGQDSLIARNVRRHSKADVLMKSAETQILLWNLQMPCLSASPASHAAIRALVKRDIRGGFSVGRVSKYHVTSTTRSEVAEETRSLQHVSASQTCRRVCSTRYSAPSLHLGLCERNAISQVPREGQGQSRIDIPDACVPYGLKAPCPKVLVPNRGAFC